ncbi:hypothetical protein HGM15179_005049 [Zosterops borbonicus]|uniref:Uncharacterized protein n=1 Tax=Zosterops borbonicus TaxID=364589 RepID=A0A8K1LPR1_9PASS|nr:hypothetical protein HGM15179_005049 [Zosterops borbonicus]
MCSWGLLWGLTHVYQLNNCGISCLEAPKKDTVVQMCSDEGQDHNANNQLFLYEIHKTKSAHNFDTHIESTLDDPMCDGPGREKKLIVRSQKKYSLHDIHVNYMCQFSVMPDTPVPSDKNIYKGSCDYDKRTNSQYLQQELDNRLGFCAYVLPSVTSKTIAEDEAEIRLLKE